MAATVVLDRFMVELLSAGNKTEVRHEGELRTLDEKKFRSVCEAAIQKALSSINMKSLVARVEVLPDGKGD